MNILQLRQGLITMRQRKWIFFVCTVYSGCLSAVIFFSHSQLVSHKRDLFEEHYAICMLEKGNGITERRFLKRIAAFHHATRWEFFSHYLVFSRMIMLNEVYYKQNALKMWQISYSISYMGSCIFFCSWLNERTGSGGCEIVCFWFYVLHCLY